MYATLALESDALASKRSSTNAENEDERKPTPGGASSGSANDGAAAAPAQVQPVNEEAKEQCDASAEAPESPPNRKAIRTRT